MEKSASFAKSHDKIKYMTLSGVFAAIIFIVTSIHVPTGNGYTHAGDGIIYLASCILPTPYAVIASAIGGALSDGLSGAIIWLPATVIIKMLTAMCFSMKCEKIVCMRNVLAIIPSMILCIVGYSFYEAMVITKSLSSAAITASLLQIPSYIIQIAASTILFISFGSILDKMNFKSRFGFYDK